MAKKKLETSASADELVPLVVEATVVLEGLGTARVPPHRAHDNILMIDGHAYSHVSEDAEGRWVYRRL